MNKNILLSLLILCCSSVFAVAQTNRYWVGASIYRNSLTSSADLTEWALTNDNGFGSWTTSAIGSSILTVDNLAGGYANKIVNVSGASPRLLPLDPNDGAIQLQVVALSAGTQFSIQVEEYNASNTLVTSQPLQEILPWQSNAGFFTVALSDFSFDVTTTQIRFIISAQNTLSTQGTIELNYFNYYNTDNSWSDGANWAASSGGAGGAGAPGTFDTAIFDAFSGTNAIVDQPASIANITLASTYKSGLINAGSNNFTVSGASQLTGGFMVGVNDHLFVHDVTVSGTQFVSTSGTITITGTLTYVSGNFKPANGTMIFVSSSPQTIPAINFYNITLNGTGAKNATGNFTVAGNFTNNSTFNAAGNTVVFNGIASQTISGTSTTTFNNITITNIYSGGVTLSSPVQLTGVLTFAVNTHLTTGGNLTLVATSPTVTASIAAFPTGAVLNGTVKVQKYIYSSLRVYRYLSSPVSGAFVSDWQSSIPITGTFSNPSTGAGIVSTSPSMYTYTESVAGVRANGYAAYPASGSSTAAALTPGKGYSIYVRNNAGRPTVLEVSGTINRGNMNVSSQMSYTSSGLSAEDGWNLVGNPYPSSIDWSLFAAADRNNIDNAVYYLDNNSASPVYRSWANGVGTNCSSGVISSSQAFWVKATGTPTLRFRETYKTAATPSFYRVGNDLSLLRISLDSTSSTFRDETVIRLTDEATIDFDSEYDAYKLYDTGHPAIGSATKVSPLLSINALSQTLNGSDTLALFVQTGQAGNYTLSVPEYTFDASITAYLWDTYIDSKKMLVAGSTYPFEVSADSATKTNRFKIILNEQSLTTGILAATSKNGVTLFPNPVDQSRIVTIRCPQARNLSADIEVYDVTGTLVYSEEQVQGTNTEYPLTLPMRLTNGIYSIRIQTEGVAASSTVIIK